jgi:polar amino acid transport system substrate-binding protein
VGLQLGSSSENALNSEPDVVETLKEVRQFSNNVEALMDLEIGRVDAVVVDEIVGRYYISKKPDIYRVLEENLGQEIYGVGLRMEDEAFLNELNRILDEMKADGTAKEISEKWFGEDIMKR